MPVQWQLGFEASTALLVLLEQDDGWVLEVYILAS